MKWHGGIKLALPLFVLGFCLLEYVLQRHCGVFREWVADFLSLQWMTLICLALWCAGFLWLSFCRSAIWLVILLLVSVIYFFFRETQSATDALVLLFSVTFGKGAGFTLKAKRGMQDGELIVARKSSTVFLLGLVLFLVLGSCWHLDVASNFYPGTRWTGLWDNPNTYGMLMGAGATLAIALLVLSLKSKVQSPKSEHKWKFIIAFLFIAVAMMGVGLAMSYSRGAWLGAALGLLYLAWSYGKLKWKHIAIGAGVLVLVFGLFWGRTPDSAPWFIKRADLGRPSAQHRASAWRAGLEIMRDHPFGVGWNNAVKTYQEHYSPPEDGAAAITTNDYLMIGTELGIAALLCFVCYVVLCLRGRCNIETEEGRLQATCRAGAIVLLVAFWFDGGLFKLPTAAMFWVLLELGAHREKEEWRMENEEANLKLVT